MSRLKIFALVAATLFVSAGSVAYGAMTAPKPAPIVQTVKSLSSAELTAQLKEDEPTIIGVLTANYPSIKTDYLINSGKLYDQGEWYGTTLTYKGADSMNRDTLRVLMQKKQGIWTLRTTPPQILLSTKEFPDVPKSVLQSINKAISLPGTDATPLTSANG
jgi:hypothetical protein